MSIPQVDRLTQTFEILLLLQQSKDLILRTMGSSELSVRTTKVAELGFTVFEVSGSSFNDITTIEHMLFHHPSWMKMPQTIGIIFALKINLVLIKDNSLDTISNFTYFINEKLQ